MDRYHGMLKIEMHLMIFVEIEEIFREDIGAQKKECPLEKFF